MRTLTLWAVVYGTLVAGAVGFCSWHYVCVEGPRLEAEVDAAHAGGVAAGRDGAPVEACPYRPRGDDRQCGRRQEAWLRGWVEGYKQRRATE